MKIIEIVCGALIVLVGFSWAQSPCLTPSRASGTCIPLKECDYLYDILTSSARISDPDREYLRQSQCGFDGRRSPKVCCAPGSRFTEADLPPPGTCGSQQLNDRVVGGQNTSITDYPWMALLEYTRPNNPPGFHCGGVAINENYILTAAHCISGTSIVRFRYNLISVRLGEHNLTTDRDCELDDCADPVVNIPVAETIVHENYKASSATQNDDIALIRLERPIQFTEWVKPICLPLSEKLREKNFENAPLVVAGFGRTENRSSSDVKLRLEVNGFSFNSCNSKYRTININILSSQLCAGGEEGKDSCNGDSGGPLMGADLLNGLSPYTYLAGVVSFGPRVCGTPGWPGVYTKVAEYNEWILNHMRR